jgi:glycosyltransferase involved in cell wall biosynthesis
MSAPFLSLAVLNYNEEDSIERAARLCSDVLQRCRVTYELVLVDDGSTDRSRSIIERMTRVLPCCRAIYHRGNLGIGAGIRTCYFQTSGEWATWFPADLQADPRELPRLLEHVNDCDALITYRDPAKRQETRKRKLISAFERFLVWLFFGVKLRDLHWIRLFRRSFLERMRLRSRSPFIDTEMVVAAKRLGARIRQVELLDQPREFGVAKGAKLSNLVYSMVDLASLRVRAFIPGQLRKSA